MKDLDNITLDDFISYVKKVRNDEITSVAPLGFSGDTYIIFENKNKPLRKEFVSKEEYIKAKEYYDNPVSRSSHVSLRKYCDECELLITDYSGNFLTYSKLNFCFSDEFIGTNFYNLFLQLKTYIDKAIDKNDEPINFDKVKFTEGFSILKALKEGKNGEEK